MKVKIDREKFETAMVKAGMPIAEVIAKSGVSSRTLYRAIRGVEVKRTTAGKIAKALDATIYELQESRGMTPEQVTKYLDLINRRLYILAHSGIHWKPEYASELEQIDQEIEKLRPIVEQERARKAGENIDHD